MADSDLSRYAEACSEAPRKSPDYSAGRALENFLLAENRKAFTTAQNETLNVIVSAATWKKMV